MVNLSSMLDRDDSGGGIMGKDGDGIREVLWPKLEDTEWEVNILEEARYQQK